MHGLRGLGPLQQVAGDDRRHLARRVQLSQFRRAAGGLSSMIIAVDGPTASGKGTIAKALAAHFGLPVLDTGLLYRAVGYQTQLDHGDPDNAADALAACDFPASLLEDPALRFESTGSLTSRRSEENTSELQSLMRIPYADF